MTTIRGCLSKTLGSLLVLFAAAAGLVSLAAGVGQEAPPPGAPAFFRHLEPDLLGSLKMPLLLVGAAAFFLGVVQIGYRAHPDGSYAHREIVQALLAGSGFAAAVAVLLGAARGWSAPTLAVLAAGGSLAAGLGLLLLLRSLWKPARPRLLAWPATAVSVGLIAFYLSVWLLGGP